jgi:ankyrin repeat protein
MSPRPLPARPNLDHLRHEAKALRSAFERGEPEAVERVHTELGERSEIKLTDAQRVLAREYGFPSWVKLRAHVMAARGVEDAVTAFVAAVTERDAARAEQVVRSEPRIANESLHVAATLGLEEDVRRLLAEDPTRVRTRIGSMSADPLLLLAYSPFHGESAERDRGLLGSARALLEAGADPNTKDSRHGVPALYAVTGDRWVPEIAHLLLDSGANPTDGESVFHAAEHFYEDALELLLSYGVDLNHTGDWGNTATYFLLRYHHVTDEPQAGKGLRWLLDHGADPNVRCRKEQETSLHIAVRTGQSPDTIELLLDHGADVNARRADGRTPLIEARRRGMDELAKLLEDAGARAEPLARADLLLSACSRGDVQEATRLASPELISSLDAEDLQLLTEAARKGRVEVVRACLAAGYPVSTTDEFGATALHQASIGGRSAVVRELLAHGADLSIRDPEHNSAPLGWAFFGADVIQESGGDYEEAVRALLDAGAPLWSREHWPRHPGVREVLERYAS